MTLGPQQGFWIQHRAPDTRTITLVGQTTEATERSETMRSGPFQIIGTTYLLPLVLADSNLWESGASGGDSIATGDRILRFNSVTQSYDAIAVLIDHTGTAYDGIWADALSFPNPSTLTLEPGVGYWFDNRAPATDFTWTYPE